MAARYFSFFLLLLLLQVRPAAAQYVPFFADGENTTPRTFYGGFAIGANFSQVDGDGFAGYNKVGLNVGPLVYARFNSFFGASMEIIYTQKGSKFREFQETSSGVPYQNQYDLKLNYIEVPVLLHYFGFRNCVPRLTYGLGVAYARLVNSKEEAYTNYPVNLYPDVYVFKKDDLSGLAEVNYEFYKGGMIQLRYNYSLRTIRDADKIPEGYGGGKFSRQINNMFSLRVMVLIK